MTTSPTATSLSQSTAATVAKLRCLLAPAGRGDLATAGERYKSQVIMPCSIDTLQRSFLGCRLRCAPASPRPRLCWHAFPCLPGPPSVRGCSADELCSILPRRTCLRLILFCTCPPLCAGALWPMPAWVWHDVRSVFLFILYCL